MTRTLSVRNRQRTRAVNTRLLGRVAGWGVEALFGDTEFELAIHLVAAAEMARLNKAFLHHDGSTDVITFDHRSLGTDGVAEASDQGSGPALRGEIFISLDDAVKQAGQFRTTWQSEMIRYVLHGLLHLRGFEDRSPSTRRRMKREENRLLRQAAREFSFQRLGRNG